MSRPGDRRRYHLNGAARRPRSAAWSASRRRRRTITIGGHDIVASPVEAKRLLAFMADEPPLFDYLTVMEHLRLTARLYRVRDAEARARALLAELQLTGKEHALPAELSRGMKQKAAIACGLLHDPAALLFDEPLTGLDPLGIRHMKETIRARGRAGAAVIVSSHLLQPRRGDLHAS